MSGLNGWSTTANSNASVGAINWAEGMLPSAVNNSGREVMSDVAKVRDGTTVASGWHVAANGLTVHDQSDTTKKVIFDVSGQSAGTTKTIAMPITAGTLALSSEVSAKAPSDATYVVVSSNGSLLAERVLTAGSNINITDSLTAGTITVAASIPAITTPAFTAKFTSSAQNLPAAGATLTVAHGLGAKPFGTRVVLVNVTGESNWVTGNEVELASAPSISTSDRNILLYSDETNVNLIVGQNGIGLFNKSTGGTFVITLGNWQAVIRAWL